MPGYAKLWDTLANKKEFLALSALNRGLYLQTILFAKARGDTGGIFLRNIQDLSSLWGCDRKTAGKSLGILQDKSFLIYTETEDGGLEITVPKYRKWQDIDVKTVVAQSRKSQGKIPPLRLDYTKPDQTIAKKKKKEEKSALPIKKNKKNIEEFDDWWQTHKPEIRDIVLNITGQEVFTEWLATWVKKHYPNMRGWFIADPTRRKKRFGQFVTNWLKKEWDKHLGDGPGMTAAEEESHYASKRRTDNGSGMTSISDIIKQGEGNG